MRVLLDTHALVWFLAGSLSLSQRARAAIEDPDNEVFVSPVSGYEVAGKARLGKLDRRMSDEMLDMVRAARLAALPVTLAHMHRAGTLPGPHRDPWDRILMAQALLEELTLVTIDPVFADYGVPTLWT